MKPLGTNNLSALGYIGLFILFCLPYVGTPALIILAIFGTGDVRNFARAILILTVFSIFAIFALIVLGLLSLSDLNFSINDGIEIFNNIRYLLG